jgi:KRAB domain-containing zinc finger protein
VFSGSEVNKLFGEENDYGEFKVKTRKSLKCRVCVQSFESKSKLKRHMSTHVKVSFHARRSKEVVAVADEEKYMEIDVDENQHVEEAPSSEIEKSEEAVETIDPCPVYCHICFATFKSIHRLKLHEVVHLEEKNFACPECDKRFKTKKYLKSHLIFHSTEKTHTCTICSTSFKWKQGLNTHIKKIHHNA